MKMIALLRRDFSLFFSKQNLLFLLPLICLACLGIFDLLPSLSGTETFATMMGIRTQNLRNPLLFSSYFILWGYYIWFCLAWFHYDYKYSPEFMLKRISFPTLLKSKLLSIGILTFCSQIILNLLIGVIFGLQNIEITFLDLLYWNILVFVIRYTMQMFFLLMFSLFHHYGYLFIILFLLLPVLRIVDIDVMGWIYEISYGWLVWLILGIFMTLGLYFYCKTHSSKLLERRD